MIFHFDFSNYFKMIGLAWRERNPSARWYYLSVLFLWVPIVSSFHAICFFLDGILFPGLWKTEIRTPVFVVGHVQSGTTLVHRLMSEDESRFSAFVLYELYFPSLLQKKLIRFYKDCVRRQIHLNGGDKIHLSKNPVFAGRVASLIETFPNARIVVPFRNPYETIPSLLKLMRSGWKRELGRRSWRDAGRPGRCVMHDDREAPDSNARKELHAAWDDMMAEFERARDAIDVPELMPAPPNDRNLAEGYRYLMGFVHGAVERAFHADPSFPFVRHVLQLVNKATIDNADAIYFAAAIDGRQSYMLRGRAQDHRHWHGSPPAESRRKAPQYLIFELSAGCLAGDSGNLAEMRPGVKTQTGKLDSTEIEVEEDGSFAILLAPERPAGHTGNFIPTLRRTSRPNPDDPEGSLDRDADGALRRVIAHRDPGVPNWLDTTGHPEGFMAPRWSYSETPPRERWPTIKATKVAFDAIREHLPEGVRSVSPEERAARIRMRQEHVQRRYRVF